MSITIKLDLPDALAEEARAAGVLQAQRLTAIIEEAIERDKQAHEFVTLLDKIRSLPGEPLSMEEIQAEVDAVREARVRREAGR